MNKQERYERESKAKGGSVPPDERRHHKGRSASAMHHMPNEGSTFHKQEQAARDSARAQDVIAVDIERLAEEENQAYNRSLDG